MFSSLGAACLGRQAAVSAKGRVQLRSSVGSAAHLAPMALRKSSFAQTSFTVRSETELSAAVNSIQMALKDGQKPIVIGLAADSGCGKSTFMRRVTALFGGECKLNDIGRETKCVAVSLAPPCARVRMPWRLFCQHQPSCLHAFFSCARCVHACLDACSASASPFLRTRLGAALLHHTASLHPSPTHELAQTLGWPAHSLSLTTSLTSTPKQA